MKDDILCLKNIYFILFFLKLMRDHRVGICILINCKYVGFRNICLQLYWNSQISVPAYQNSIESLSGLLLMDLNVDERFACLSVGLRVLDSGQSHNFFSILGRTNR